MPEGQDLAPMNRFTEAGGAMARAVPVLAAPDAAAPAQAKDSMAGFGVGRPDLRQTDAVRLVSEVRSIHVDEIRAVCMAHNETEAEVTGIVAVPPLTDVAVSHRSRPVAGGSFESGFPGGFDSGFAGLPEGAERESRSRVLIEVLDFVPERDGAVHVNHAVGEASPRDHRRAADCRGSAA
ncbi:hypothetical protein [Pararhodobacter sp.]